MWVNCSQTLMPLGITPDAAFDPAISARVELLQITRPKSLDHDSYVDGGGFWKFLEHVDCQPMCWRWRAIRPRVERLPARFQARWQRCSRNRCRRPIFIQPVERWRPARSDADDIGDGVHASENAAWNCPLQHDNRRVLTDAPMTQVEVVTQFVGSRSPSRRPSGRMRSGASQGGP
jgi:hypothetical protein